MCRVVVEHGGRRLWVGRAELVDERGRLYALAGGTAFRP
jgi:acyl-coenzyme A thioesterase PaaI-like protein